MSFSLILTATITFSATFIAYYSLNLHYYLKKYYLLLRYKGDKDKVRKKSFTKNKLFDCFPCWIARTELITLLILTHNPIITIIATLILYTLAVVTDKIMEG